MTGSAAVLLVEDNPDDAALALRVLAEHGIDRQIMLVKDGAEALDYLFGEGIYAERDTRQQPSVVFLDLKMPKIGGLEVLKRMRADERTRGVPVVVLTSSGEEQDIAASYDLGANGYVCKPVDFERFSEVMRELGVYWLFVNVPPPQGRRG